MLYALKRLWLGLCLIILTSAILLIADRPRLAPGGPVAVKRIAIVQHANTQLKRKVLFGSDYPLITPDRWLADFEKIDIRPEVRPLILKQNAIELLKLKP